LIINFLIIIAVAFFHLMKTNWNSYF